MKKIFSLLSFFSALVAVAQPQALFSAHNGDANNTHFLSAWSYYRPFTVTNAGTGQDLTATQYKLSLTGSNFSFAHALSSGNDLRITDSLGNVLPAYLESYNSGSQTATVWFKSNVAKDALKNFRLYYGNTSASSVSSYDDVFTKPAVEEGTVALWNFDEGTGTSLTDATGNFTASLHSASWSTDSKFASGHQIVMDGSSSYISINGLMDSLSGMNTIAFDLTVGDDFSSGDRRLIHKYWGDNNNRIDILVYNGQLTIIPVRDGTSTFLQFGSQTWTVGQTYRIAISYGVQTFAYYRDGVLFKEMDMGGSGSVYPNKAGGTPSPLYLGTFYNGSAFQSFLNGKIDALVVTRTFFTPEKAKADAERRKIIPTQIADKLSQLGDFVLGLGSSGDYDDKGNYEPVLIKKSGVWNMLHTAATTGANSIANATSSTLSGTFTRTTGNPLIGNSAVGSRPAAHSFLFTYGSYYYLYSEGTDGGGSELFLSRSTDLVTWTDMGKVLGHSEVPGASLIGNPCLIAQGGTIYLLMEAFVSDHWEQHLFSTTNPETTSWTYVSATSGLSPQSSHTAGGSFVWYDGTYYHNFYHYSGDLSPTTYGGTQLPTRLWYARSTDLVNWSNNELVLDVLHNPWEYSTEQAADADVEEEGGATYVFYTICQNGGSFKNQIMRHKFPGTRAQLVSGGSITTTIASETPN